jgi:hypothetical protein
MKLNQTTPVVFSYDMDDQVFACAECGTEVTQHPKAAVTKTSIPREELEDVMLAALRRTVVCADMREVAIFAAAGLRSRATWIVASFLPGSSDAERSLETVHHVERVLQSRYDMTPDS